MLQYLKKVSFLGTLALTLTISQSAFAMDDQAACKFTGAPVSLSPASSTQSMDDLISQDPIKKFAFQANNLAKEKKNKCSCSECLCFSLKSYALWEFVKDTDTTSPEVKNSMTAYANTDHAFDRLPLEMKTWLTEQGYRTGSNAHSPESCIRSGLLFQLLILSGANSVTLYLPESPSADKDSSK